MDKNKILSSIQKFRLLFPYAIDCPDKIMSDISSITPTNHMVFPCDVVELRPILIRDKISFSNPIPLFSLKFADKYLKGYPVFLVLDVSKIVIDNYKYGGIQLNFTDELDISKLLYRIIVNEPIAIGSFDVVKKIVEDLNVGVECLISNSVPGISSPNPKLSISNNKMKKTMQIITHSDIKLTPKEKNIFEFLRKVKKDNNLSIQMRVAGGWVRDKLLGKTSDDIDIAINMPGYDFAKLVAQDAFRNNINSDSKAYKVSLEKSADPSVKEPSDKLMVGAVYLFGQKIEFVPMRTEYYPDPNSRQPQITTTNDPKEDVKRRDLTINALYYNIDTGKIDDFVGGINDLGINGGSKIILRTPDDPFKTFHEDPLRLLRVLRFHSRYSNSEIEPSIIEAMRNKDIQESYRKKVATERAGPELMKMLAGDNPIDSLRLLFDSGLYKTVFKVPSMENINPDGIHMNQQTPHHKFNLLDHTLKVVENMNKIMKDSGENDYMRGLMNVASLFHDFGKMKIGIQKPHPKNKGQMQYLGHENASQKMADEILKSIGVGKDERDIVNQVIGLHMRPLDADKWGPKGKGNFLRDTRMHGKEDVHKDLWKYIFYHAKADTMASQPDRFDNKKNDEVFNNFKNFVESPSGSFKGTVINGNDVMKLFPDLKPDTGYIKEVLDYVKEMQDTNQIDVGGDINTAKQRAIDLVNQIAPQIINKYKEASMGENWFKKVIKAQVSLPLDATLLKKDEEIVKGPLPSSSKYYVGMRVRDRRKGVAAQQTYGVVDAIKGNQVRIIWNPDDKEKKKSEVFDMIENTELLSILVEEI